MPNALLLYNPAAGRFPVRPFIQGSASVLAEYGWSVELVETESGSHATEIASQAARDKIPAVFTVGGDGTISQVAAGLTGSDTALGVLPAGTSNVLGHELGLPAFSWARWWTLEENARLLAEAAVCPVDVGLCNDRHFVMWTGLGLDALAVRQVEPRQRIEKFFAVPHYAAATIWNASFWGGVSLRLQVDGTHVEGHYLLAVVNNIRHYMGGLANLSDDAYLDDGVMDLWLFTGGSLGDAFRHAFDMMAGRHVNSGLTRRIPFRHLSVEADVPVTVQIDGDPVPACRSAEIRILPRALKLLVPQSAMHLLSSTPTNGS